MMKLYRTYAWHCQHVLEGNLALSGHQPGCLSPARWPVGHRFSVETVRRIIQLICQACTEQSGLLAGKSSSSL